MRKKELEKLKKPLATDQMLRLAAEDKGEFIKYTYPYTRKDDGYMKYRHYRYFLAAEENGYLVVGMFLRRELVQGIREARMYLYFSKKEDFLTYDMRKQKWSRAKIGNLDCGKEPGQYREDYAWSRKQDEQRVNSFFGYRGRKLEAAVRDFQDEVRNRKQQAEMEKIDRVMECVPGIPEGFLAWLEGDGTYGSRYLFYHAEERGREKSGRCSCCGTDVMVGNPKNGELRKCPSCRKEVTLCSWNKKRHIVDKAEVGLIQKLTDGSGFVIRRFLVWKEYYREEDWKHYLEYAEDVRETYSMELVKREHYEYGRFKRTGIARWCLHANEPGKRKQYRDDYDFESARFYPGNIRQLRKGTIFQYVPLEGILRKNPGMCLNRVKLIRTLKDRPQVEYLYRMKLYRLAGEYLNERFELAPGKKPWDRLGITKEQMEDCIRHNAGCAELETMWQLNGMGYQASWNEMKWLQENITYAGIRTLLPGTTVHKLKRYMETQETKTEAKGTALAQIYIDYMDMAEKLGWDTADGFVRFPGRLGEAHDMAAALINERNSKLGRMKLKQKNIEYQKLLPRLRELYGYEDDTYQIMIPEEKEDFIQEGQRQHNCVGGVYFDKVLKKESAVLFLRKKEEPEKSYCTVEMKGFELLQCYAAYNQPADRETKLWMERYVEKMKKQEQKRIMQKRGKKGGQQAAAAV